MSFCNSLTFFRIWTSAKTQPTSNVIWRSHGVHLVNINVYAKFHHNIPLSSRGSAIITLSEFKSWAKPRPMKNDISQSLGLDLVSINVYATVYQNIPLGLRDRAIFTFSDLVNINVYAKVYQNIPLSIFTFSEFEPRQRLGQSQMTFDNLLGYILSISMRMQNFIKIFQRFKSYGHFSRTGGRQNLHKLSGDKIKHLIIEHSKKFNFQLTFLGLCN